MRIESELRLDFDDVLIRPKRSIAPSRASIDLERDYRFRAAVPPAEWAGIPIIAANLDTIGTMRMAAALHELHVLTCLHKYYPLDQLIEFFTNSPARHSTFLHLGDTGRRLRQAQGIRQEGSGQCESDLHRCCQRLHQVLCGSGETCP